MTLLSCTNFKVNTVGIWGIIYDNLGKMGQNNALNHGLGYFDVISKSSNPQFASNKVIKTKVLVVKNLWYEEGILEKLQREIQSL